MEPLVVLWRALWDHVCDTEGGGIEGDELLELLAAHGFLDYVPYDPEGVHADLMLWGDACFEPRDMIYVLSDLGRRLLGVGATAGGSSIAGYAQGGA